MVALHVPGKNIQSNYQITTIFISRGSLQIKLVISTRVFYKQLSETLIWSVFKTSSEVVVLPLASCVTMKSYSALLSCLIFALAPTSPGLPYSPLTEIKQGVQKTVDIGSQVVDFTPGLDEITAAGKDFVPRSN